MPAAGHVNTLLQLDQNTDQELPCFGKVKDVGVAESLAVMPTLPGLTLTCSWLRVTMGTAGVHVDCITTAEAVLFKVTLIQNRMDRILPTSVYARLFRLLTLRAVAEFRTRPQHSTYRFLTSNLLHTILGKL